MPQTSVLVAGLRSLWAWSTHNLFGVEKIPDMFWQDLGRLQLGYLGGGMGRMYPESQNTGRDIRCGVAFKV